MSKENDLAINLAKTKERNTDLCIVNQNLRVENRIYERRNRAQSDYISRLELENEDLAGDIQKKQLKILAVQGENRLLIIGLVLAVMAFVVLGYGIIYGWWK